MPEEDPRISELRKRREKASGGEKRIARQHAKGKLTAHERLDILLDSGTFHELDSFTLQRKDGLEIKTGKYTAGEYPGDGVVTGYGQIEWRMVFVYAQDFTVLGGTLGEMHGDKICRVMDMAVQGGNPIIGLIDSGGDRIQ